MNITCPHGYTVTTENVLEVFIYMHPDGKGCPLLNMFKTQSEGILRQYMILHNFEDCVETRAALATKGAAQREIYRYLSTLEGETFKNQLQSVLTMYLSFQGSHGYMKDIIAAFGPVMISNIHILTGQDFSKYSTNGKKFLPCYDIKKLTIAQASAAQKDRKATLKEQARSFSQGRRG